MISGDAGEREEILTVSWASLEKRKQEFEDLVNRQIPQNTRDIATARSYGDLRENFEFKSAKEQQRVLMRRRAEPRATFPAPVEPTLKTPMLAKSRSGRS